MLPELGLLWHLKRIYNVVILGKRWRTRNVHGIWHTWPVKDAMRHEVVNCPCGPQQCDCEDDCTEQLHWSLDAREGMR
jgi:hypothetical protein